MRTKYSLAHSKTIRSALVGSSLFCAFVAPTAASAQSAPLPAPNTLVSVCSGVSLPRSVVTDIMDPVLTGIYGPIENNVNQTLGALSNPLLGLVGLPGSLSVDVNGLLTSAAAGNNISVAAVAQDGTLVGPSDQCDAAADSFTLDTPAGIAIGGNQITGLGATGQQANAGEINSVAIGNNAATAASALNSIALGPNASVGAGATNSIAIGSGASATAANSVALGAGSVATRPNSVDVGGRQITGVVAGTQPTDAVNLGQLTAATQDAVQYNDSTHTIVTFNGVGGTLLTNVRPGAVTATSTDAINGSQLFGVQTQVTNNTTAITNLQTSVGGNTTAITNLSIAVTNGAIGPVQYSNPGTPTVPNGGTPTNDVTLVGAAPGPVGLHNVANGLVAAGSTDAINGGQLFTALSGAVSDAVIYDNSSHTSVTLNAGGASTVIHNVGNGVVSTDAVNLGQLNSATGNIVNISNAYTDLRFDLLDHRMGKDRSDARSGTSAALAAAGMPQAMEAGRSMISGGVGTYRGKVGFALGASYRAKNGQSIYKVGLTYDSSQHVGANAGAGFEF